MELKKLTIDSLDIPALEEINEEAIPDCEKEFDAELVGEFKEHLSTIVYENG